MTTIELSPAGKLRITHNNHVMDFPVSGAGAQLLSQVLTGIAMNKNKLNTKGAPSQWLIDDLIKKWQDDQPKYQEPDFMKDIEL
jgi:hypothetical protein